MTNSLHFSDADLDAYFQSHPAERARYAPEETARGNGYRVLEPVAVASVIKKQASPYAPYRSRTEQRYAMHLEQRKHDHLLKDWWYEPIKGLYLAPKTSYTPDFLISSKGDAAPMFVEVKGAFIRDKDRIKAKLAAAKYPCFRFVLAQWKGGTWHHSIIPAH